ncbi:MAG TPA: division/cell wall cluster transcriptional repressor MraZ [Candidatus Eremiobacteraceae bacterium]|jgi:MraZ protein|nr:division/cell wall cluster transcriptional repressor MraZ [Candidatus Eremiobacteraceae bacterium]
MSAFPKFTGQYEHSLDDKGRLTIPARLRARLGDHFVLTIAPPEPCLVMYPEATWSEFCAKLEAAPRKDAQYRAFVRHLFAHTEEISLDSQGRLLLPAALREMADIKRDAVLVGTLTRVEIWPAEGWRGVNAPPDHMADLMTELGLY